MSALARHFLSEKKSVSGSDRELTDVTKALEAEGVKIMTPQTAGNITKNLDLIIYTEAMSEDNEEMIAARAKKVPMLNYFDALGLAMNPYHLIAVAGTHGKTTTTAMLTDVFEAAEKDPTAVIGSLRAKTGSNYRAGKSKYAIVEACEYKEDFLSLRPETLIITNIEHEHVDCYETLADVQQAFRQLVSQVAEDGLVVADTSDQNVVPVLEGCGRRIINYPDYLDFTALMKIPGVHNRLNAAAAKAAAANEGIDAGVAQNSLSQFRGTLRRFEYKGKVAGAPVYDDYAHHPTEISATIAGTKELYPDHDIVVVFKPHTYSRTAALFDSFAKSFAGAKQVYLLPIYAAREENTWGVSSRELAVKTLEVVPAAQYVETHEEVVSLVRTHATSRQVILVMGAGDVTQVAGELVG